MRISIEVQTVNPDHTEPYRPTGQTLGVRAGGMEGLVRLVWVDGSFIEVYVEDLIASLRIFEQNDEQLDERLDEQDDVLAVPDPRG